MARIRLVVETGRGADDAELEQIEEFCVIVASMAREHGHELTVAAAGHGEFGDQDLVLAVPTGYPQAIGADLEAARVSEVPVALFLPDHVSVPPSVRENPMVVEVRKWFRLGSALREIGRFLGLYRGPVAVQ